MTSFVREGGGLETKVDLGFFLPKIYKLWLCAVSVGFPDNTVLNAGITFIHRFDSKTLYLPQIIMHSLQFEAQGGSAEFRRRVFEIFATVRRSAQFRSVIDIR